MAFAAQIGRGTAISGSTTLAEAVAALERRMITGALAATDDDDSAAARRLGRSRVGLSKMMTRLGLRGSPKA